jgi:hypothetical protein
MLVVSNEWIRTVVPFAGECAFYRIQGNFRLAPTGNSPGDAVYGYGTEFGHQL